MLKGIVIRGTVLAAVLMLSAGSWAGTVRAKLRSPLIQTNVVRMLERAEMATDRGQFYEAMACVEAVTLKPVVKIGFDPKGMNFGEWLTARKTLARAVENWEEVLGGEVEFELSAPKKADIRVSFLPEVKHLGRDVAGTATWSRQVMQWGRDDFMSRVKASVRVRTVLPDGSLMPEDAMVQATMHEIGHVFGLWDSAVVGEVMGPLRLDRPATSFSARELNALHDLRDSAKMIWEASVSAIETR